jgi:hypothetical protein
MDNPHQNGHEDGQHPPREQLLLHVDRELLGKEAALIETHLGACWSCRARVSKIEKSIADFIEFDGAVLTPRVSPPPNGWRNFDRALEQLAAESGRRSLLSIVFGSLERFFHRAHLSLLPQTWIRLAVSLLIAIVILGVILRSKQVPVVSASELLRNATQAQAVKLRAAAEPVIYQKLRVRRASSASARSETAILETWNDATRGRFRQSIEDAGGRRLLPLAANNKAAGANQAAEPATPTVLAELAEVLEANHMDPQRPLSAASYQSWRNAIEPKREEVAQAQLPSGLDTLSLRTIPAAEVNAGQILEATFAVRAQDWLPYELRLKVKAEEGERIYEITEQASEVVSLARLSPEIFAEPPLVAPPIPAITSKPKPSPAAAPSPVKINPAPPAATPELEIEVLSLLNQIGATLGEEVSVARALDGSLRVEGVAENAERQGKILSALAPVKDHPAIKLQIETPEEAAARLEQLRQSSNPVTVQIQEAAPASSAIALDAELRRYLTAQGTPADKLDEAVNQFANRALRRSRQAMLYVWSLRKLLERFSANDLRALEAQARGKWLALIGEHAQGYQREIAPLRQELSSLLHIELSADEMIGEIADEADLARAALRLNELGAATDEAIRAAFTLSGGGSSSIKSPQFWRTMGSAELLAQRIEKAAQQLKNTTSMSHR